MLRAPSAAARCCSCQWAIHQQLPQQHPLPQSTRSTSCRHVRARCEHQAASSRQQVVNKQPITSVMDDRLYSYLLDHTREPQILRDLREESAAMSGARMQIAPEQGQFMGQLARLMGATRYLEIGVFTGYSSLAVALALPESGLVVALDSDEKSMEVAKRYWERAGVATRVESHVGPAMDTLDAVERKHGAHSFDFAFVDADKRGYRAYYEKLLHLVRPGGLIAIDNVLWYGKVADPEVHDKATVALRELNAFLLTDKRVDFNIVPVGDGIAMCRIL